MALGDAHGFGFDVLPGLGLFGFLLLLGRRLLFLGRCLLALSAVRFHFGRRARFLRLSRFPQARPGRRRLLLLLLRRLFLLLLLRHRIGDLLLPVEREEDRDLPSRELGGELPRLASPGDRDAQPELVGESNPALDVVLAIGFADQAQLAVQQLVRSFEIRIPRRSPARPPLRVALFQESVAASVEEVLAELREVAHQGRRIAGAARAECRVLKDLALHDEIARRRVARREQGALPRQELAARGAEEQPESLLAVLLRDVSAEVGDIDRAKRGMDPLAIGLAHVDLHVRILRRRTVAIDDWRRERAATRRPRVEECRQRDPALAFHDLATGRNLARRIDDRLDASIPHEDRFRRRIRSAREPHVTDRVGSRTLLPGLSRRARNEREQRAEDDRAHCARRFEGGHA